MAGRGRIGSGYLGAMPTPLIAAGATLVCSMGSAPGTLLVPPGTQVLIGGAAAAAVTDTATMANVPSFGMCRSLGNPEVASATSSAQGVLTPQPCVPTVLARWLPGAATVFVGGNPAVDQTCTCACTYGGMVSVSRPGQETVLG
ncbi:hypothetical protein Athai_47220 [Actinocatenispora thailandica]|uniref:DUF4280 domain-containing protein n=1 Tax=Actinocatenispora thailandica TaxID=227318 RepID=A0A7R7HZC6_9ACTN|nr:DUF4280 domain-containing protein [Actinocatenispora thailandica]BCJ37219.1 hypothetical protein Athai_47220 [Actinocatenispora thailandica]